MAYKKGETYLPTYLPTYLHSLFSYLFLFLSISIQTLLTLVLLTWRTGSVPNNASRWQMGFDSAFKGINSYILSDNR